MFNHLLPQEVRVRHKEAVMNLTQPFGEPLEKEPLAPTRFRSGGSTEGDVFHQGGEEDNE